MSKLYLKPHFIDKFGRAQNHEGRLYRYFRFVRAAKGSWYRWGG